jgi:hypothetical protein
MRPFSLLVPAVNDIIAMGSLLTPTPDISDPGYTWNLVTRHPGYEEFPWRRRNYENTDNCDGEGFVFEARQVG